MKRGLRQKLKKLAQKVILPFCYFINRPKKVIEGRIVLADAHHDSCPIHMSRVREALKQNGYDLEEWYVDLSKYGAFAGLREMCRFMKVYAQAEYVIVCDNFLPVASCNKKAKTTVIQLWHGCGAFKKFGYDTIEDCFGYSEHVYRNHDIVTVTSDYCTKIYSHAMRLPMKFVRTLGNSFSDRLFDKDYIEACQAKFRYGYSDVDGRKVVVWAPTFRGYANEASLYGEEYIDRLQNDPDIKDRIYVIKCPHPHIKDNKNTIESDCAMHTDELLPVCDVLITDYSSVFFEALLCSCSLVFFAPDYNIYAHDRGFYLDYKQLPGEVICGVVSEKKRARVDFDENLYTELKNGLLLAMEHPKQHEKERISFCKKYMNACDGTSTDKILEASIRGYKRRNNSDGEKGNA